KEKIEYREARKIRRLYLPPTPWAPFLSSFTWRFKARMPLCLTVGSNVLASGGRSFALTLAFEHQLFDNSKTTSR
ncbi:MAG: hypothetical protein KDC75_16080, partial [Phaeodactylibacter sp.]|nr:hypothetical protein [Phaeodactylibacter sp.]